MQSKTKILIAAGVIALGAAAGTYGIAQAEGYGGWRGHHGGGHHGMHDGGGHHGGWGRGGHFRKKMRRMRMYRDRYDSSGDGALSQDEIDAGRRSDLETFDANKDGVLSLEEYGQLWLDLKRQRMIRAFQHYDRNGDAGVTLEEYSRHTKGIVERFDRNDDGVLSRKDRPRWRRGGWGKRRHDGRGWGRHHREGGWGRHHRGERMRHGRWYDSDDSRDSDRGEAEKRESDKE